MAIDTVNNDQPSNIAWTSLQAAQTEESQTEEVEKTQTPEQIENDIKDLDQEITKAIAEAAKMLDDGVNMDSEEFKDKYDEIMKLYQERGKKQEALNKATGDTEVDESAYPPSIMSEILKAMKNEGIKEDLQKTMQETIEKLNREWAIIRDAIVNSILASFSGNAVGRKISTDDDKGSTSASASTTNGLMDLIKQTEESKNKSADKKEDTKTPTELTDSQPAPNTDSPPTT